MIQKTKAMTTVQTTKLNGSDRTFVLASNGRTTVANFILVCLIPDYGLETTRPPDFLFAAVLG